MIDPQKIIVALDMPHPQAAVDLVKSLAGLGVKFKIGMELFYSAGWSVVESVQKYGDVFLDLKLHDIPTTMGKTASVLAKRGVWLFTVHASAGQEALLAVSEAVQKEASEHNLTKVVAVTVLTSLPHLAHLGVSCSTQQSVLQLTQLASTANLHGVVCSSQEVALLKQQFPQLIFVTPGIRRLQDASDDQTRSLTPEQAIAAGSDYLVIGRPVTQSSDPMQSLTSIINHR